MNLQFAIAGDVQIDRKILRVAGRMVDARPAFVAIGNLLIDETKEQFDTEGQHASGGWKPLKEATVERKRRLGLRLEILQETGSLIDSLTAKGDPNMVFKPTRSQIEFGSKLPYAEAHQNPKPGSHLPRRRPIELTERARRESVRILQRYLITGVVVA